LGAGTTLLVSLISRRWLVSLVAVRNYWLIINIFGKFVVMHGNWIRSTTNKKIKTTLIAIARGGYFKPISFPFSLFAWTAKTRVHGSYLAVASGYKT
jgi:hypothetical protein